MSFGWGAQVASAGVRTHRLLVPLFNATVGARPPAGAAVGQAGGAGYGGGATDTLQLTTSDKIIDVSSNVLLSTEASVGRILLTSQRQAGDRQGIEYSSVQPKK